MIGRRNTAALALSVLALGACSGTGGKAGLASANRPAPTDKTSKTLSMKQLEAELEAALAGKPSVAAFSLAHAVEGRGRRLSDGEMDALIRFADALPAAELRALTGETDAAAIVDLRTAMVLRHRGDREGALRLLGRIEHSQRLAAHREALRNSLQSPLVDSSLVAVLLPMSGKYAAIGDELWAGISLAAAEESGARVAVFDTLGTEAGATKAVQAAVEAGALIALGPAGRLESRAAATAAAEAQMPIALLAPENRGTDAQSGVFRLALAPGFEAEQAAIVAMELGYRLLAIMTPRDALGREQTRAFVETATAAGAEVVAVGSYDPSAANLQQDFKKFLEIEATVNPRYRKHIRAYGRNSWKSFTPTLPFDFLYIPDTVERGSLAASYLPFFNVEVRTHDEMSINRLRTKHRGRMPRIVQLMGGSSWLDPSLGARGGAAVEGALVIGTCPGGHGMDLSEAGRRFSDAFIASQGRPPSAAAATANDAMNMVLSVRQRAAAHGGTRAEAAARMRTAELRDGVCGTLSVDAQGQVQGEIEVLRVEQGNLEIYEY